MDAIGLPHTRCAGSSRRSYCLPRTHKRLLEVVERLLQVGLNGVVERLLLLDRLRKVRIDRVHVLIKLGLKVADLIDRKIVDVAVGAGEDDGDLSPEVQWLELWLLQDL